VLVVVRNYHCGVITMIGPSRGGDNNGNSIHNYGNEGGSEGWYLGW
jgi:hypothetical protein